MTSFGHTIFGITCGMFFIPREIALRKLLYLLPLFALAGNVPDLKIKGWGHYQYYFSHSIFVTLGMTLALWLLYLTVCRALRFKARHMLAIGLACTWLSHLLLDSLYNHGDGIRIFWPVSQAALALPIPWLSVMDVSIPYFAWHNVRIFLIEMATFMPLFLLSLIFRYRLLKQNRNLLKHHESLT